MSNDCSNCKLRPFYFDPSVDCQCKDCINNSRKEYMNLNNTNLKIIQLTHEHLKVIADAKPDWVADNRPEWMVQNRLSWVTYNRPDILTEYDALVPDNVAQILNWYLDDLIKERNYNSSSPTNTKLQLNAKEIFEDLMKLSTNEWDGLRIRSETLEKYIETLVKKINKGL